MAKQVSVSGRAVHPAANGDGVRELLPDLAYLKTAIVNVVFIGGSGAGDRGWVLVDAGIIGAASAVRSAAAERFGKDARPSAIVLTHGHFDHIGALKELADAWDAPVLAHALELPYLSGRAAYPPADPKVGGGVMSLLSPLFPTTPVDVSGRLSALPVDGTVPGLSGWRWMHTPGHSVGHVSLWRERDRTLVAGDAIVTTAQESVYAVAAQAPELHGPPMYFTVDWQKAATSARLLAALEPELLITGHGPPLQGSGMREDLATLAAHFETDAVPAGGRYVERPAGVDDGSAYPDP